jgi:Ion transport protein
MASWHQGCDDTHIRPTLLRAGIAYTVAINILEGLLLVDMCVNSCRAFYNEKGVLMSDLKQIRLHYMSHTFILDLVAAMPFQLLVIANGQVNEGYAAWLRLPKMLRVSLHMCEPVHVQAFLDRHIGVLDIACDSRSCNGHFWLYANFSPFFVVQVYRMFRYYSDLQKSTSRTSVVMGILRLMPLILVLTHIYACIWWYIGTVGQPSTVAAYNDLIGDDAGTPAHWIYFYSGLGVQDLWPNDVAIGKQYIMSFYWMASTLSTSSLVGQTTPKNQTEIIFTIWCAAGPSNDLHKRANPLDGHHH